LPTKLSVMCAGVCGLPTKLSSVMCADVCRLSTKLSVMCADCRCVWVAY